MTNHSSRGGGTYPKGRWQVAQLRVIMYVAHVRIPATIASMLLIRFLNEVRKELKVLITGSLLLGVLGLYQAATKRDVPWWIYAATGAVFSGWAFYGAWRKEHLRAEAERAKNEAAPRIDISVLSVVPHGNLGGGLTDLFFNARLVLEEPSTASIREFALEIFNEAQWATIPATEDADEWELVKPVGGYSRFPCAPLLKELARRGDPVQGWIHFQLPGLSEYAVGLSTLTLKVNCVHGTCCLPVSGSHVHPDPDTKGVMRKKVRE